MSDFIFNNIFCPFSLWIKAYQWITSVVYCFISSLIEFDICIDVFALLSWLTFHLRTSHSLSSSGYSTSNTACILRWNVIFGAFGGNIAGKRIMSSCYKIKVTVCSIYSWSVGSSLPAPACCGKTGLTCLTPRQPVSSHHRLTAAIVTLTQMQG